MPVTLLTMRCFSLCVDDGLETLLLGGGGGGDTLLFYLCGSPNTLFLGGDGNGGPFALSCDPLSLRQDGGLDATLLDDGAHSFELQPITLRRGDGLESLTFRLGRSLYVLSLRLLTFSLRPRRGLGPVSLRLRQGLKSLFLRLDTPLF